MVARREIEMGGRLMRDMKRRRRTTLLKAASVRPVLEKGGNRLVSEGYSMLFLGKGMEGCKR